MIGVFDDCSAVVGLLEDVLDNHRCPIDGQVNVVALDFDPIDIFKIIRVQQLIHRGDQGAVADGDAIALVKAEIGDDVGFTINLLGIEIKGVVVGAACQRVVTYSAIQEVAASTTINVVIAPPARKEVYPVATINCLTTSRATNIVASTGTINRCLLYTSDAADE